MMMTKVSTHRSYDSSSSILNLNLFNFFDFSLFLLLLLLLALITSRGKQQLFNYFFGCRSFVSPMRKVETIWVVRMTRQTLREHKRKRERERDFYWETRLSNLKNCSTFVRKFRLASCSRFLPHPATHSTYWAIQCDKFGQFIALWATFQSLRQQLFCPNCAHFRQFLWRCQNLLFF